MPQALAGGCTAPPDLIKLGLPLPTFLGAVHGTAPIRIIALGSSSTWGAGASNRAHSYPARLEQELRSAWPNRKIEVINAGVNGQLASDMLARIDRDVRPYAPQLVIWQTGVNDHITGVPIETFKQQLRTGIAKLHALGADVVLLDQQFYPRFQTVKNGQLYVAAVREIGEQFGVPVIQRFRIMQHLIQSAQFTTTSMLAPDQFHLNDQAYTCMGRLMALSLESAVVTGQPAQLAGATNKQM